MVMKVSRRWRWWSRRCFEDGDHKHKMMMAISCHIFWLHVMFIFYASYLALIDGSIIRWSLTKFKGKSVLPEYAPFLQFIVPRHHVMIGCDRLYVQIQRVQNSCTRGILRLNLTSLAYADMASEHGDRKVERESYSRYDQHSDVHHWNYSISRDDRTRPSRLGSCNT